jgi:hypothetical protein
VPPITIDGDARRQSLIVFVDCRIDHAAHEAAKEIDGELAPNASIAIAVEDLLRDLFEQWKRGGEIDECVALIVGYEFSAPLDE